MRKFLPLLDPPSPPVLQGVVALQELQGIQYSSTQGLQALLIPKVVIIFEYIYFIMFNLIISSVFVWGSEVEELVTALRTATHGKRGKSVEPRPAPESMDWDVSAIPGPSATSKSTWRVPPSAQEELALPSTVKETLAKKSSSKSKKPPKKPWWLK